MDKGRNRDGPRRAGVYGRVSTTGQTAETQLVALRAYATARGWAVHEYVDQGISGAKASRPALDALLKAARGRQIDLVVCTKLDRLAQPTHHLVSLAKTWSAWPRSWRPWGWT